MLNVRDFDEANRVLKTSLDFLIYMRPGDLLVTASAKFHKIGPDLIQIDPNVDAQTFMDSLHKRKVIKFPG